VIARLTADTRKVLQLPGVKEKLAGVGAEPAGNSPEEYFAFIRSETEKWSRVIRTGRISLE
jgi:tripartite-type tricarboxylate transporter receptor subunit TctC